MKTIPVNVATEDELSEVILLKLLTHSARFAVGTCNRRGGFGYLRNRIDGWNSAARGIPFILLTDLDECECPQKLLETWLKVPRHPNLLFRVAVREVEAWILADRKNFSKFLGIDERFIPTESDLLPDPKKALVAAAARSRNKSIRESIVPKLGSTAKQGPDYNACLSGFVQKDWNVRLAQKHSPSLARTIVRLAAFTPTFK